MNIFVLHRGDEVPCAKRIHSLGQHGNVILCSDLEAIKPGFRSMCSFISFPEITSWDVAFSKLADDPKDSWFIENDVRWGKNALSKLFELGDRREELVSCEYSLQCDDPDWYWWQHYAHHFTQPAKSFNPVCRLRESLIHKILDFRNRHSSFVFHELLFASLADSCFDLKTTKLAGKSFRWRPEVKAMEMLYPSRLYHPVKKS